MEGREGMIEITRKGGRKRIRQDAEGEGGVTERTWLFCQAIMPRKGGDTC